MKIKSLYIETETGNKEIPESLFISNKCFFQGAYMFFFHFL